MWLALQPSAPGALTDWATAVRLLEKECSLCGGCSTRESLLLAVPLMFEVLALKVCETLASEDAAGDALDADDESETLAACVAHLFIAAKTVAATIRRDASAASSTVRPGCASHTPRLPRR